MNNLTASASVVKILQKSLDILLIVYELWQSQHQTFVYGCVNSYKPDPLIQHKNGESCSHNLHISACNFGIKYPTSSWSGVLITLFIQCTSWALPQIWQHKGIIYPLGTGPEFYMCDGHAMPVYVRRSCCMTVLRRGQKPADILSNKKSSFYY